jgi:taurine dioxygenase
MTVTLEVRPVTGVIGAELSGVDIAQPLDGDTVAAIRGALLEHQVIFFRDQDVTEEEQLRFAEYFGTPMLSVYDTLAAEQPKITVLDTDAPKGRGTDRWHADHTFSEFPPLGAILRAVEVPSSGGDTCFASMGAAYEALSPTMRDFLDGLTAIHTTELVDAMVAKISNVVRRSENPPMQHPVVWVHPETGRKLLWVNQNWTTRVVELTAAESEALLAYLYHHLESPEFQCRFRWEPGSVAFWDNRAVQHFAVPDYHERRIMRRVMMAGTDRPVGPQGQVAHAVK